MHMKKYSFIFASLGALLLASCAKTSNDVQEPENTSAQKAAVTFGAYVNRPTKAGNAGSEMSNSNLGEKGFGVFAYYSNGGVYNNTSRPDFMYNEKVYISGGEWAYSPLKYWPNEFGQDAASDDVDRLTFFAYAPWVDVNTTTGVLTSAYDDSSAEKSTKTGIISLPRNSATGDPLVRYVASMNPSEGVDLCWGVAATAFDSAITDHVSNDVAAGSPYINVAKPTTGAKIDMKFLHALSQLNVQIDANVDEESGTAGFLDDQTYIYVRSITFDGFALRGALNLNSTESAGPTWLDYTGVGLLGQGTVSVYDGRRDGKEGIEGAVANDEAPLGLNPKLVQSKPYSASPTPGVPATEPINLFSSETATDPVYVIPTGGSMAVTIVYDVETKDPNLLSSTLSDGVTHGSTISNAITANLSSITMEAGKRYNLNIHIGMTSVKFDAAVTEWVEDPANNQDVNVPINAEVTVTIGIDGVPVTPGSGAGI